MWKAALSSKNVITRDQVNLNANYVEESAVDAVKNMGIGTNFGNCTDVVAMWMNMNSNSVTDFEKAWGQVPTTKPMVDFLKGEGKITEINVAETLKDVRRALLDADVNYKVAKTFTDTVKQKALGQNVLTAIKPQQLMVKIVHDELALLMGGETTDMSLKGFNGSGLEENYEDVFKLANRKTQEGLIVWRWTADGENWKTLNCLHSRCIGSRMGLFRRPKTGMKYEKNLGSHPKILRMLMMLRWNSNDMACSFFHFCRKGLEKL